ncbi:hypothetical protein [Clostridium thailandense]|uniref:hypothetical protein n=1 Tax=Clostridium thailandense TaxID=2794346 RepID=UPI001FEB4542|nr:hypothetical protein [Clostridium thailandense]
MFPKCYLDYMNSDYRALPPMPNSSMFPNTMNMGGTPMQGYMPGSSFPGPMQDTDMDQMQDTGMNEMGGTEIIPGGTSSGAPTPGGVPGPVPSALPGGVPGSGTTSPFVTAPGSPVILDTQYTQGYLRTKIGRRVRVTFLLGTNTLQDRVGILKEVGISYIVLREQDTNTDVLGDIYSIKFVDIFPSAPTVTT